MTPMYYFKDSEKKEVNSAAAGKTYIGQVVDQHWFPGWICIDRGYDENSCLSSALIMMPNRAVARFNSNAKGIIHAHELIEGEAAKKLVIAAVFPEPKPRTPKPPSEAQRQLDALYTKEYEELQRKSKERLAKQAAKKQNE